jgi:hypothetical protein
MFPGPNSDAVFVPSPRAIPNTPRCIYTTLTASVHRRLHGLVHIDGGLLYIELPAYMRDVLKNQSNTMTPNCTSIYEENPSGLTCLIENYPHVVDVACALSKLKMIIIVGFCE